MLTVGDFAAFFRAVHGVTPFPWQDRLLRQIAREGTWPEVLDLPTGCGKTAALDIAVFHLALDAAQGAGRRAPLRIAFVVDRRLIVDDAFHRAQKIARALTQAVDPILCEVSAALRRLTGADQPPLVVCRLRGGAPREDDWARTPVQPTILCSTVDQVGSRLLFRGYGVSDRMKPVHAGLLGSDCLLLLDEAHLAEPFRQTLSNIGRLRRGDPAPWRYALLSATAGREVETAFALDDADRADPLLAARLAASKPAAIVEIGNRQGVASEARRVEAVAEQVKTVLERLQQTVPNPALGVVVNRVARARAVFERVTHELAGAETVLIIGPARSVDREEQASGELQPIRTDEPRCLDRPLIVVATQTIEAGVDIDLDGLITEAAALDSLRQRFGRLNRAGRPIAARAAILAHKEDIGPKADDPVYGDRIARTWAALEKQAADHGAVEFGIDGFPPELLSSAYLAAEKPNAPVLLPAYADLWSQTSPIPNADPEPALFLHGPKRSPAGVQIVWRADVAWRAYMPAKDLDDQHRARLIDLFELLPPRSSETVEVPLWAARAWLRQQQTVPDFSDIAESGPEEIGRGLGRTAFRYAGRDSERTGFVDTRDPPDRRALRPGDLIVVPADYGGCDRWGWAPLARDDVVDVAEQAAWPYRAKRYAVRLTAELIRQGLLGETQDRAATVPMAESIQERLADMLAEHEERDNVADLLNAAMAFELLPQSRRRYLEPLANCRGRLEHRFCYGFDDQDRPRGVVFVARFGLRDVPAADDLAAVPATESEDLGSTAGYSQSLDEHSLEVRDRARDFGALAGLDPDVVADVALAGYLHDAGKADPRFQAYLAGGDPFGWDDRHPLAKSGRRFLPHEARERAGLPPNWRHEALSVRLARRHPEFAKAKDPGLVLWLIGVHHGFGRPLFPHADPCDREPRDLAPALGGDLCLDAGEGPQSLAFDHAGRDWAQIFLDLKQRYGIWGLARLEAFVRLADHRASEAAGQDRARGQAQTRPTDG